MFNFFGRKDACKKPAPEKELDGFVIVGELPEDEKQRKQRVNPVQPALGVVVMPSKAPCEDSLRSAPSQSAPSQSAPSQSTPSQSAPVAAPSAVDGGPSLPELLSDVPFTLAPHILAMQAGGLQQQLPDMLLTRDINDNLARFRYDFSLENSVLCDS